MDSDKNKALSKLILLAIGGMVLVAGLAFLVTGTLVSRDVDISTDKAEDQGEPGSDGSTTGTRSLPDGVETGPSGQVDINTSATEGPIPGSTAAPSPLDTADHSMPPTALGPDEDRPDGRPSAPPDGPDIPITMNGQIHNLVLKAKAESGPEAQDMGKQLLEAEEALLRVAGAAILAETGGLSEDILAQIAEDDDMSVPMNVIGWLHDTGHDDEMHSLWNSLSSRGIDGNAIDDLLASGTLTGSGGRLALELALSNLASEDALDLYSAVSANDAEDYSVRMKAALLLRETMGFVEYRDEIKEMKGAATDENPLWKDGIDRLANNLEGPVPVHTGVPAITPDNIDEMLAMEYPMMLEDLALHIEQIVTKDDAYVQEGTADRLAEYLEKYDKLPWSEEQQMSLRRLHSSTNSIYALETDDPLPPSVPAPPPAAQRL